MSRRIAKEKRGGGAHENYATPIWAVRRLFEAVDLPIGGRWLEPCAGGGNIIRAASEFEWSGQVTWTVIEIREECRPDLERAMVEGAYPPKDGSIVVGDFLKFMLEDRREGWDCVVMNPPFTMIEPFVVKARQLAPFTVCLCRLNWFSSGERAELFGDRGIGMPAKVLILPNRPSFSPDGKTDASEYCWAIWDRHRRRESVLSRLAITPKEERRPPRRKPGAVLPPTSPPTVEDLKARLERLERERTGAAGV